MALLTVYLAGDISPECWRAKVIDACKDLDIEFLSPVDNVKYSYQSLIHAHKTRAIFHLADEEKLNRCHIIFAYFRKDGFDVEMGTLFSGTSWELGWIRQAGKHSIVVNDMNPALECRYELVKRFADIYCKTLEEGIDCLKEYYFEMAYKPKEV